MTIDDFEWVVEGFVTWHLVHKQRDMTIAGLTSFNGWHVRVLGMYSRSNPLVVESFDAAKAIATIMATTNMETYPDATNFRTRALRAGPKKIPKGIFKVG
jgi:hypothetical protein